MERSTSFLNLLPDGGDYEKATKISEDLLSNKKHRCAQSDVDSGGKYGNT